MWQSNFLHNRKRSSSLFPYLSLSLSVCCKSGSVSASSQVKCQVQSMCVCKLIHPIATQSAEEIHQQPLLSGERLACGSTVAQIDTKKTKFDSAQCTPCGRSVLCRAWRNQKQNPNEFCETSLSFPVRLVIMQIVRVNSTEKGITDLFANSIEMK